MNEKKRKLAVELINDVEDLRAMILRLENQVAKNEAVIKEMLLQDTIDHSLSADVFDNKDKSVIEMIKEILPQFTGKFWYSDLKKKLIETYPSSEVRIRNGIHPACSLLKSKGVIALVDGSLVVCK